ncbi:MAG: class I SAM-dependent methyltransferase, partial [Acidovorax sp.]
MAMPWPLPAVLAWAGAWLAFAALRPFAPPLAAVLLGCAVGVAGSVLAATWWRRALVALGFPLSLLLAGGAVLPGWAWLLPLAVLLLVYPLNAWRDAPLFPTPRGALRGLEAAAPLPPGAAVLDAGCGLG